MSRQAFEETVNFNIAIHRSKASICKKIISILQRLDNNICTVHETEHEVDELDEYENSMSLEKQLQRPISQKLSAMPKIPTTNNIEKIVKRQMSIFAVEGKLGTNLAYECGVSTSFLLRAGFIQKLNRN